MCVKVLSIAVLGWCRHTTQPEGGRRNSEIELDELILHVQLVAAILNDVAQEPAVL